MPEPNGRYVLPEFTERTSHGTRTQDPYSKLLQERIVMLGTPIDDTAANDVMAQLVHLEHAAPDLDIQLYINSPGGSFTATTAIYDTMRFVGCDIQTVCLGQAAGSAALLLAAGAPGKRLATPGARVVLRQPYVGEPTHGQLSDLQIQAAEVARQRAEIERLLAAHTGRGTEEVHAALERDTVLGGEQARAFGLVDEITRSRKASAAGGVG